MRSTISFYLKNNLKENITTTTEVLYLYVMEFKTFAEYYRTSRKW